MSVCIVDTSVFCNLLEVPNLDQQRDRAIHELEEYIEAGVRLLLPMATIYETGNHIAQQGDGRMRRRCSDRFVHQVRAALGGDSPFSPTYIHQIGEVEEWLDDFPDRAMQGMGLGDLSIIHIWHRQSALNPSRRVFIWAYDDHLAGYDRPPAL